MFVYIFLILGFCNFIKLNKNYFNWFFFFLNLFTYYASDMIWQLDKTHYILIVYLKMQINIIYFLNYFLKFHLLK